MNADKQKRLEAKGWVFESVEEFLMSDRGQIMEAVENFLFENGERLRFPEEVNGAVLDAMADFAIEQVNNAVANEKAVYDLGYNDGVKAERKRIAGQLYELWTQSGTDTDYRHKVATFAKKLLEAE